MQQIETFKRENELAPESTENGEATASVDFDDEIDLRAEDDALIAKELEAEREAKAAADAAAAAAESDDEDADSDEAKPASRRRGRRGRGRRTKAGPLEGTFDHGEEGYGLWLDPAVADNPTYAEHWAGHRPVEVTIEEDRIVITRAGDGDGEDDD